MEYPSKVVCASKGTTAIDGLCMFKFDIVACDHTLMFSISVLCASTLSGRIKLQRPIYINIFDKWQTLSWNSVCLSSTSLNRDCKMSSNCHIYWLDAESFWNSSGDTKSLMWFEGWVAGCCTWHNIGTRLLWITKVHATTSCMWEYVHSTKNYSGPGFIIRQGRDSRGNGFR